MLPFLLDRTNFSSGFFYLCNSWISQLFKLPLLCSNFVNLRLETTPISPIWSIQEKITYLHVVNFVHLINLAESILGHVINCNSQNEFDFIHLISVDQRIEPCSCSVY